MHFGEPGTINSHVSSTGIAVMAASTKKTTPKAQADRAWDEIIDNLIIENEPPVEYIKQVTIRTKDGKSHRVSGKHFAEIIEQEKHLSPEESEIKSCKMSINFDKLRQDVDAWTDDLIKRMDGTGARVIRRKASKTQNKTKSQSTSKKSATKSTKSKR